MLKSEFDRKRAYQNGMIARVNKLKCCPYGESEPIMKSYWFAGYNDKDMELA